VITNHENIFTVYVLLANFKTKKSKHKGETNVALWKISLFCPYLPNKEHNKTLNLNFNPHSTRFWLVEEGVGEIPSQSSVVLQLYINSTRSVPETVCVLSQDALLLTSTAAVGGCPRVITSSKLKDKKVLHLLRETQKSKARVVCHSRIGKGGKHRACRTNRGALSVRPLSVWPA